MRLPPEEQKALVIRWREQTRARKANPLEQQPDERQMLEHDIKVTRVELIEAIDAVRRISDDLAMLEAAWRLRWGDGQP